MSHIVQIHMTLPPRKIVTLSHEIGLEEFTKWLHHFAMQFDKAQNALK